MPLKKGSSRATVSSNVETLMHDYEKKGAIGNSQPDSKKKAQKQAVAIALDKARKSGGGGKGALPKKPATSRKSTTRKSTVARSK